MDQQEAAIGYVRVSTLQQADEGHSLAAQEAKVTEAAERLGYSLEVVREEGRSAKNVSGRPVLRDTLDRLAAGDAQVLIVAKLDRLARSVVDLATIVEASGREGWRLVLLDLDLDTGTPSGRLVLNILGSIAEFERQLIGQRVKDIHAFRASQGITWGRDAGCVADPVLAQHVVDLRADGLSYRAIADQFEVEELPTRFGGRWHPATVRNLEFAKVLV